MPTVLDIIFGNYLLAVLVMGLEVVPFTRNHPLISNISYVHSSQLVSVAAFGLFADRRL